MPAKKPIATRRSTTAGETAGNKALLDSFAKGLTLLRLFASNGSSLTIQEAAEKLSITRAASRRLLLTLENQGYARQDGRAFFITPKVLELGYAYFAGMDLPTLARPALRRLCQDIGHTCSLAVLDNASVVLIAREEPEQMVRLDLSVGRRMPAYAHSLGRVLLAELDRAEWEQYLAQTELRKFTRHTIANRSGLERVLRQVREEGYCTLIDEMVEGLGGMSVPLRNAEGRIIAAMGISMVLGSRSRETMVRDYLPALRAAAAEVEGLLQSLRT